MQRYHPVGYVPKSELPLADKSTAMALILALRCKFPADSIRPDNVESHRESAQKLPSSPKSEVHHNAITHSAAGQNRCFDENLEFIKIINSFFHQ